MRQPLVRTMKLQRISITEKMRLTLLSVCAWCGRKRNPRECPAYGKTCGKCGELGHFKRYLSESGFCEEQKGGKADL